MAMGTERERRLDHVQMRSRFESPADDRGQVTVLAALAVALLVTFTLILIAVGSRAVHRAEAQTRADLIALAAATDGTEAGLEIAQANGVEARDVVFSSNGSDHRVDIVHADQPASAQARAGEITLNGLIPALAAAVDRAGDLMGQPVIVVSGFRSRAEQEHLWSTRPLNPYPVAEPGTSDHELGLAIDVPASQAPLLASVAARVGLCQPLPVADPVHFVWCGAP